MLNMAPVPLPIDRPCVLPLEVRYAKGNASALRGFGIDLYWVTPDARRDAKGRPIAEIVPAAALFVEPPEKPAMATASRPHCTMHCNVLYLALRPDKEATLTVRVADNRGQPLAGKRVHVSQIVDNGPTGTIVQPVQPTDAKGETTATFHPNENNEQQIRFYATVLGDFVDVGQVAELITENPRGSWFPDTYSPFYDPKHFQIEPNPPVPRKSTTFRVPVQNNTQFAADVFLTLWTQASNIGGMGWGEVARSENFTLRPGESKRVTMTWIFEPAPGHQCFRVIVNGWVHDKKDDGKGLNPAEFLTLLTLQEPKGKPDPKGKSTELDGRQQNLGKVAPTPTPTPAPPPKPPLRPTPIVPNFDWWNFVTGIPGFIWSTVADAWGPTPPGFDPLNPDLAVPALQGWVDTQQALRARELDGLGDHVGAQQIRNMPREEFLRKYCK
jgi:hypothetical protein